MNKEDQKFLKKQPHQARAKATVAAILEAATYILVRDGQENFNTNAIAEKAGVSIASLYQYFDDKNAILNELQRCHVEKTRENTVQISEHYKEDSLEVLVSQIIECGIAAHTADPELHRIFGKILPQRQINEIPLNDTFHLQSLKSVLESNGMQHYKVEFTVWLFRTIVHACIHEGIYSHHEDIVSGRLSETLNAMLIDWLKKEIALISCDTDF